MQERKMVLAPLVSLAALLILFGSFFWRSAFTTLEITEDEFGSDEFVEKFLAVSGEERMALIANLLEHDLGLYSSEPDEFHFSDGRGMWGSESGWHDLFLKGDLPLRITAATVLWQKHSGYFTRDVLRFLEEEQSDREEMKSLRQMVEASFQPDNILKELRDGDYLWGTWLAYLRPHERFVEPLLSNLDTKPKHLSETVLALGRTRDRRALEPLSKVLKSSEDISAGFAAMSLGHLGFSDAEPLLIEELSADSGWRQVNACQGLAMIGTPRALPALDRLAKDDRYTGALSIRGTAQSAIDAINDRTK